MAEFPAIDAAIVGLYVVVIFIVGFLASRNIRDTDDFFLAGRGLGFAVIGFSLFASNISGTTLIGLSGQAYAAGISVANYEWMAGLIFLVMAFITVPIFYRNRLSTIPEYFEKRFDSRIRRYISAMTIFLSIFVDTAGSIYAGALILQVFVPGLPFWPTCLGLALFAGLYTVAGGLRAVVYTDVIQAVVLLGGATALTLIIFADTGWSWQAATGALPEGHLSLIRPLDDPHLPWLGTLIGVPILGFYYWSTNQYIVQRVLAARSLDHARWGLTLAGLLKLTPMFIMVLPGAMAISILPGIERPDAVFPTLVTELLPVGLRGLVLAALIAAIMSTIDSTLNAASTLVFYDFLGERRREKMGMAGALRFGRLLTLGFMVVAALWAPMIRNFPGIFAYLQEIFSYAVPPVVAIFVIGLFWRGATPRAALVTLIFGHILGLCALIATQAGWLTLHFTITAGITTGLCALVCLAVSLAVPEKVAPDRAGVIWHRGLVAPDGPHAWYADYRVQVIGVALLTLAIVAAFW
ncbi:MAG: sodium:solute symporter [Alphaproteobacteria bacterium]|nr:sodium:solute symporter [Alphaproteobacteria bacterium]MBU0796375.1 sodium:solute symporter [Alphaproteobacteria bacterium]